MPGQQWDFEIKRAFKKAEIIVIFLSNQSIDKRGYVQRELKAAVKYLEEKLSDDIYIIPVKLDDDVEVPEVLESIHWINISHPDALPIIAKSISKQFERLGYQKNEIEKSQELTVGSKVIKESWEGLPGYEVELSIPIIHSDRFKNVTEITSIIEGDLTSTLQGHRADKLSQMPEFYSWGQDRFLRTNTFDAFFTHTVKERILSIVYSVDWYGAGAAHPNQHFETYIFFLEPLHRVTSLNQLFDEPDSAFLVLVELVRNELRALKYSSDDEDSGGLLDEKWILDGTASWADLSKYSCGESSITFYFSPYQVGPYVVGPQTVDVPYQKFVHLLGREAKSALGVRWLDAL